MKMIIQSEKDLQMLQGKFVIQIDSKVPDKTLMDYEWGFVKEKRLKLICGNGFADLYGYVQKYDSFEEFKNLFNNYSWDFRVTDGGRFHRLLTNKELDYLLGKIKEENY